MELNSLSFGDETLVYSDRQLVIPPSATQQMLEILERWSKISPFEPTYVMRSYGIPSLIARFDGVIDDDGQFHTYEIQGGCGWIGYAGVINSAFKEKRDALSRETWPSIKLLMPPVYHNDDEMWLKRISLEEALKSSSVLMIRRWLFHELNAEHRVALFNRSIKPMYYQNDKQYGLEFGWWKRVLWDAGNDDLLPWDEGFVLKPLRNQGSADIMVWNPRERKGRATRTQILSTLSRHTSMYLQRFIPPMRTLINGHDYNLMLRPFFGFDTRERKWVPMHGVWVARPYPNLRLHGASDAISGPLFMEASRA